MPYRPADPAWSLDQVAGRGLGVSEDTIKSHRKNVYVKLDIGTQSELFSLFIDALANAQGVLGKDPLESYMGKLR